MGSLEKTIGWMSRCGEDSKFRDSLGTMEYANVKGFNWTDCRQCSNALLTFICLLYRILGNSNYWRDWFCHVSWDGSFILRLDNVPKLLCS